MLLVRGDSGSSRHGFDSHFPMVSSGSTPGNVFVVFTLPL